ncbi:MAG: tyrosinase family protein [Chloroflexota bacterium]|nr:tyrosinase family protein [Chloroflexota bacterium]
MNTVLTIEGATSTGANYLTWSPLRASIRLVDAGGVAGPVAVTMRNRGAAQAGRVVFFEAVPGTEEDELPLLLPTNGTAVEFFVAGKFGRPSLADKDAIIEAVQTSSGTVLSRTPVMVRIRKNANNLTVGERNRFLSALAALNNSGMGRFSDFRNMHRSAAQDEGHGLPGFLPWHRAYLLDLERELQQIDPSVALPYWRFDQPAGRVFTQAFMGVPGPNDRLMFSPSNPLQSWTTDQVQGIIRRPRFTATTQAANNQGRPVRNENLTLRLGGTANLYSDFSFNLEDNPHGAAHVCFDGYLRSIGNAPRDPLFFLLHANVDRLWAKWQWTRLRFDAANPATYHLQGSAGSPGAERIGHNLNDTMWPWNQDMTLPRPSTAPGGNFPTSAVAPAPTPTPAVREMIDHQGIIAAGNRLGFDYDDVRFEP